MRTDSRLQRRELRNFRRITVGVVALLLGLSALLGTANTAQGPRLSTAELNGQGAISRTGQRLVLHANQPIAEVGARQVTISPTVDFTATSSGNDVTITLGEMLRYNGDYTVSVRVKSLYSGGSATLDYAFTTPDIPLFTLIRDPGTPGQDAPDRIVRSSLSGDELSEDVFTAPRIQEYAVSGQTLAVVVLDENDRTSLVVRDMANGTDNEIHVPRPGKLRSLRSSGASGLFGVTVLGESQADGSTSPTTLSVYDPSVPNGIARQVAGFDTAERTVYGWAFVPGTTSAVIQDLDQQLYLVDVASESAPTPLGRHPEVHGFTPGTAELIVTDLETSTSIDLQAGTTSDFTFAEPDVDPSYYPGKRVVIDEDKTYIQQFDVPDANRQYSTSGLFLITDTSTEQIFRPAPTTRIRNVCVSPNGQIAAIETFAESKKNDEYPNVPSYLPMTTYYVDLDSTETLRSLVGWMPDWCQ